ncbi:putative Dol-P-Glc:Glc(2)Man(9)GlcNAc(2)-PP-Dol alpha-1,2-glucosyltransferase [Toxorhynchites rutilus septentrionalis]|uniref:putative Dol-P-Glc:Glc(2)Man(9)GlcNAc(2)-PP-Dol alpha-1,2-glucosyltransferase n=1 Tax=Toxorhynchites rutilus septentrionalis TaxID=329112 RepID=UPI00247A07AF|nr:putative Dol-P-Glc:Glc(2)Man(9)GlcNAc(2)-PP-Dol alpha-1,2-glucosyltransferase [Toxorhynchites rutilus septentrionalis]
MLRSYYGQFLFLGIYTGITLWIFHQVYHTSQQVIDEEFHLKQGKYYCHGQFDIWDGKITTLPGLYLISAFILGPFGACSTYALRLISLVASIANVCFIFSIRRMVTGIRSERKVHLECMSLSILPPLYFFSHLYYTDVLSVTTVLMMIFASFKGMHNIGALAAFVAILMRQTNIVWVVFVLGSNILNCAMTICLANKKSSGKEVQRYGMKSLITSVETIIRSPSIVITILRRCCSLYLGYILNMIGFVIFLLYNGSIVVGDKTAHVAAIHVPQIFYFTIFFAIFSGSHIFSCLRRMLRFVRKKWYITVLCCALFVVIVSKNTIVHPYLLADNRHYTFYIWNRFYGKWWFARYLPIPIYFGVIVILGWMLLGNSGQQNIALSLFWIAATFVSVALQQLVEVRYFILPFLVLRLIQTSVRVSTKLLVLEFIINVIINVATFFIFATKTFHWANYAEPQRIIW